MRITLWLLSLFGSTGVALFAAAVNYTYDPAGRLALIDYGNGATIAYTYDKAGREYAVTVYVLRVTEEKAVWPERAERTRLWVPPAEAADMASVTSSTVTRRAPVIVIGKCVALCTIS